MKFAPLRPLSRFGRVSRSIILVALILGSLFPTVGDIGVATIASPLALLVVVYEIGRWLPRLHRVLLVPVPFLLVWAHASFFPPMTEYGQDKISTWLTATLLTAVAASMLRDEKAIYTFCRTWLIATGFLAIITILGFTGGRADGFDSNPIWLARAMASGIVMALFLVSQKRMRVWWFLGISVLLVVGMLATGSRGPILAVGLGAIALVLFDRRHRIRRVLGISIGAVAAYWAVANLPFFANSRYADFLADGDSDAFRRIFWEVTPPVVAAHPEGVGIGNWIVFADAPKYFNWPHNLFLEVFSELGVGFGIGLVALILAIVIGLLRRSRQTPVAILVLALLIAELGQVSTSGDLNGRTFWFLMTLGFLVAVGSVLAPNTEKASPAPEGAKEASMYSRSVRP